MAAPAVYAAAVIDFPPRPGTLTPEALVTSGNARLEILRVARAGQAELIVMGVQGRGAITLLLFGSTTHHVIREGGMPVLTLRALAQ